MRTTTKRSKFAALAVGLSLVVAACGGDDTTETTDGTTETTTGNTGDTTDTTGESGAAMRVTYTLSDVAVWDDGSAISAADFQCTLDAVMNTPGSLSTTGYDQVISIAEGATPKDIVVEFSSKYAPWRLLFNGLLKAAYHEEQGGCADVSEQFDQTIPYSGREWQIDSWSAEQLVLVPNAGYMGARKPGVDRLVFVPAEDGPTVLKSGAVDFIFPQAYTGIDEELSDPNVDSQSAGGGSFEGFYFQSYDKPETPEQEPFSDPVFRSAFSKSIDRDAIYEQIYAPFAQGLPLLDCGPIAPGPYCDGVFAGSYDPEGAAALLEGEGWTKNADGFWEKDGKRKNTCGRA